MEVKAIKELREKTKAGIALIKAALVACKGDPAAAEAYIAAHRPQPRDAGQAAGRIFADVHNGRIGAMVELRCATDFVANTDEFRWLGRELVLQVIGGSGEGVLQEQPSVRDPSRTVGELIQECSAKLGEQITARRHVRWELEK
jgi:elongation factor Ts